MKYILYGGLRHGGKLLAIREALKKCPGNILHIKRGERTMLEMHIKCKLCKRDYSLLMPVEAYVQWTQGTPIQDALRMLSPGERELLISGVCEECFDVLAKELNYD